jgi:hypothetical protein
MEELAVWMESAFSFTAPIHLSPRGQSRRGEAATPCHYRKSNLLEFNVF